MGVGQERPPPAPPAAYLHQGAGVHCRLTEYRTRGCRIRRTGSTLRPAQTGHHVQYLMCALSKLNWRSIEHHTVHQVHSIVEQTNYRGVIHCQKL